MHNNELHTPVQQQYFFDKKITKYNVTQNNSRGQRNKLSYRFTSVSITSGISAAVDTAAKVAGGSGEDTAMPEGRPSPGGETHQMVLSLVNRLFTITDFY